MSSQAQIAGGRRPGESRTRSHAGDRSRMSIELRVARADELERFARLREQGYAIPVNQRAGWVERMAATGRTERLIGAFDRDRLVGMLNVLAFEQWFGGRAVPMGGIASVVVVPEERGHGLAPRMLAHALALMAERGEVVSTLGPATTWVYRKCGWELAGHYGVASIADVGSRRVGRGRGA